MDQPGFESLRRHLRCEWGRLCRLKRLVRVRLTDPALGVLEPDVEWLAYATLYDDADIRSTRPVILVGLARTVSIGAACSLSILAWSGSKAHQ